MCGDGGGIPQARHTCIPEATDDGNSQRHICHLLSGVSVRAGEQCLSRQKKEAEKCQTDSNRWERWRRGELRSSCLEGSVAVYKAYA